MSMDICLETGSVTIPEDFRDSIHRFFGSEGDQWFSGLGAILQKCLWKWDLHTCEIAGDLSVNLICYAISPVYGPVVLKIGFPHPEFYSELAALALYRDRDVCKLYDSDVDLGAMLLQRIIPGFNLKTIKSEDKRLEIAVGVISKLPMPTASHPAIPAFRDWIDRAFARARCEQKMTAELLFYLDQAEKLFDEMTALEPADILLHGDLHHENILYSTDGRWMVIDPKGITGIRSLEAGRYILNAIWFTPDARKPAVLSQLVSAFSHAFQRSQHTIAICAFIDCVLSQTWSFEEYLTPEAYARAITEAQKLFPLYFDCVQHTT